MELIGDCSLVRSLQQRLSGQSNRMTACGEEFCNGDGVELHGYLHALGGTRHGCEVFITMLLSHDTFLPQAPNSATHFLREEEVEGEVI